MPREANKKCVECASHNIGIARAKPCWKGKKCHDLRSWHRNKDTRNAERKAKRSQTKKLAVPQPQIPPYAILYIERMGGAKDSKIVGMYARYFEQGKLKDETQPYRNRVLPSAYWKEYAANILKILQGKYPDLKGFVEQVNIDKSN